MKILFVLAHPIPSPSAAWRRVSFFAEFFKKKCNKVFISGAVNIPPFRAVANVEKGKGIPLLKTTFTLPFWWNPLISLLNAIIHFVCLTPLFLMLRPKAVIVSVPPTEPCIGLFLTSRLAGCKFIVDYRDESEDYLISISKNKLSRIAFQFNKSLMSALYKKSDLITTVTPNFVDSLKSRGVTNVRLIPNGADVTVFKRYDKNIIRRKLELGDNDFIIVYSGGIGGYYRLDVVVKAVKKLVDKSLNDVRLLIAGDGEISKILNLARKLNISSRIKYLGSINDREELAKLIATSDAGIIPYDDNPLWKNSVPAKFYEYCACGIPVIATVHNDSYLEELIKKHEIGVTSPPLDEEKLANAIYWLYKNKSFREAAGKRARQLIEEKFDRNKMAEEYLNLIETTL